jgi:hypothetical protein
MRLRQITGMRHTKFCMDLGHKRTSEFWIQDFLYVNSYKVGLGPTRPPIQWVSASLSLGVKRPAHEADHSPQSSAEVKERVELFLHSPTTPSWRGD